MKYPLTDSADCVLCKAVFAPVIGPVEKGQAYPIYCSLCTIWIPIYPGNPVRSAFRTVLNLEGLQLAQALQDVLVNCPCGGSFGHDAGRRCYACLAKVDKQISATAPKVPTIYNVEKLKVWEPQMLAYIMQKLETKEETLTSLIEKFESGKIDAEQYMDGIDEIRRREFIQVSVIQTWAMMLGAEAFRAAEEMELAERYGARIIVSIASALEMSSGTSVLTSLTKEVDNWDGTIGRELKMFLTKSGGGGGI
jgi:hypothetical protein